MIKHFNELEEGEMFKHRNAIFIKVSERKSRSFVKVNACMILLGGYKHIDDDTEVTVVG